MAKSKVGAKLKLFWSNWNRIAFKADFFSFVLKLLLQFPQKEYLKIVPTQKM